jgi:hypothetical protein
MAKEIVAGRRRFTTSAAPERVNCNLLLAMSRCMNLEFARRSILFHVDAAHRVAIGCRSIHDFHSTFEPRDLFSGKAKGTLKKDETLQIILGRVRHSDQKVAVKDALHEEIPSTPKALNLLAILGGTVERINIEAKVGGCGIKESKTFVEKLH